MRYAPLLDNGFSYRFSLVSVLSYISVFRPHLANDAKSSHYLLFYIPLQLFLVYHIVALIVHVLYILLARRRAEAHFSFLIIVTVYENFASS